MAILEWNEKTRLKLVFLLVILAPIEGLLKVLLPAFPIVEVFTLQGAAVGGYVGAKSVTDNNERKYANNNDVDK